MREGAKPLEDDMETAIFESIIAKVTEVVMEELNNNEYDSFEELIAATVGTTLWQVMEHAPAIEKTGE